VPSRRDVGVSLWRPDLNWRDSEAIGCALLHLPASLWLLGLGHLGQAYCWVIGILPYGCPEDVNLGLVDYDKVVEGNLATQLLVHSRDIDERKTRVVANAFKELEFDTVIVERPFDKNFRPDIRRCEPTVALAGFDSRDSRLLLDESRFDWVVDGGLGTFVVEFLDIVLNTFPSTQDPSIAFPDARRTPSWLPSAYEAGIGRRVKEGETSEGARCGILAIAGVNIGAAFVGAFAASLVVADVLRLLHSGKSLSVVHVDLRHPKNLSATQNTAPGKATPPFTSVQKQN
jgi:hypothetical protein